MFFYENKVLEQHFSARPKTHFNRFASFCFLFLPFYGFLHVCLMIFRGKVMCIRLNSRKYLLDRFKMTKWIWQRRTLTIEHYQNWNLNLMKPTNLNIRSGGGGPVQAHLTSIFWGVKLMFVGEVNFGQVLTLRFVSVKIFRSKSNQN